jgi:hypothetical protein
MEGASLENGLRSEDPSSNEGKRELQNTSANPRAPEPRYAAFRLTCGAAKSTVRDGPIPQLKSPEEKR